MPERSHIWTAFRRFSDGYWNLYSELLLVWRRTDSMEKRNGCLVIPLGELKLYFMKTGQFVLSRVRLCASERCKQTRSERRQTIPKNSELKKRKKRNSFFFCQRHALSMSFDIFVVTYRVTNFLPKLVNMLTFFSVGTTEFPSLEFPIFGYCRIVTRPWRSWPLHGCRRQIQPTHPPSAMWTPSEAPCPEVCSASMQQAALTKMKKNNLQNSSPSCFNT